MKFKSIRKTKRPDLVVSEERGVRHLHVGGEAIQSAMRLDDPHALELDYTRCMMAFLLFHPQPRRALMIGLGGGSLAKFFHRRLTGLRTHVVECDERVIATARALFHVPADDARLTVEHGDGVEALAPECCDLLVVDGYEDESTPAAMVSQAFFDAGWCALREPGVLVMNFMNDDPDFDRNLQRIERAFGGAVIAFQSLRDPNIVVLGLKGAPASLEWDVLRARAAALEKSYRLPFPRYVERLRTMNRWTADELVIGAAPGTA
ncbi:MAG TPA: fused MFS/spermidine synthase [Burkholderiales bacterium]|nr:fused MFS/spermidine synthase [Burkholderiales bacterium]